MLHSAEPGDVQVDCSRLEQFLSTAVPVQLLKSHIESLVEKVLVLGVGQSGVGLPQSQNVVDSPWVEHVVDRPVAPFRSAPRLEDEAAKVLENRADHSNPLVEQSLDVCFPHQHNHVVATHKVNKGLDETEAGEAFRRVHEAHCFRPVVLHSIEVLPLDPVQYKWTNLVDEGKVVRKGFGDVLLQFFTHHELVFIESGRC